MPIATQRLFNQVAGYEIRWRLARTAWDMFLTAPLLGHGIGTLPWQFFLDNSRYPLGEGPAVAEHAHNVLLQLLAEYGLFPVSITLFILFRWVRALWRQPWQVETWWMLSLLSVAAIHSMLEYPLWYSFFLGPVSLLLGAAAQPAVMLNNGRRGAAMSALVIAIGVVPLVSQRIDYTRLEQRFNAPVSNDNKVWRQTIDDLVRIQRDSLLSPYVMLSLSAMMELNKGELPAKVEVCQQAIKFAPSKRIVFKCAALTALAGKNGEAVRLAEQALRAYPKEAAAIAAEYKAQAATFPELLPLQKLAERYTAEAKLLP